MLMTTPQVGWQVAANYSSQTPISVAAISFHVPPPPADAANLNQETLYYFPYLMNVAHTELLQPILTWSAQAKSWEVYVGYYHGADAPFLTSPATYVAPGQELTAILAYNLPGFTGGFASIEGTHSALYVPDLTLGSHSPFDGPLNQFGVALEQYGVVDPHFAAPNISFDHIALISAGQPINPAAQMQPELFQGSGYQVDILGQGAPLASIDFWHV